MNLDDLLKTDRDANALFQSFPKQAQRQLRSCGDSINSLAALRDYGINLTAQSKPPYPNPVEDDSKLDPTLKAHWTMEHQV